MSDTTPSDTTTEVMESVEGSQPSVDQADSGFDFSERYGEVAVDADGAPIFDPLPPTALVNAVLFARDLGVRGVDASVGVYNLLGDNYVVPQAYYADHAPIPAEPFEVMGRLRYRFAL
jgi:outer membrane receptor protein involved in Fe transport